jgi:hypothetical protein
MCQQQPKATESQLARCHRHTFFAYQQASYTESSHRHRYIESPRYANGKESRCGRSPKMLVLMIFSRDVNFSKCALVRGSVHFYFGMAMFWPGLDAGAFAPPSGVHSSTHGRAMQKPHWFHEKQLTRRSVAHERARKDRSKVQLVANEPLQPFR